MRTKNAMNNIFLSFANNLLNSVLKFLVQMTFIKTLGIEYLGLNAFLINVIAILSLTELGITNAISYSLYKPLAANDKNKINEIMSIYKKMYQYIALITFVLGFSILFFINNIINTVISPYILICAFVLFLGSNLVSYLYGYKRTLIVADQKNHVILPTIMVVSMFVSFFQIITLILFQNYILFVVIIFIFKIIENFFVNLIVDKKYPDVNYTTNYSKKENSEYHIILKNVKAMILHKIGEISINSTDNIIIASFISVIIVGKYNNYYMIISIILSFITVFFNSIMSVLGNLIVTESQNRQLEIFNLLNFISYCLISVTGIILFETLSPFIQLWLNDSSLILSRNIVLILIINYYFLGIRMPLSTLKMAAGIYVQDKYIPIIQSFINLFFSIILVQEFGLIGVFIGTLLSSLFVFVARPVIVLNELFPGKVIKYFKINLYNIFTFSLFLFLISNINNLLFPHLSWITFIFKILFTFMCSSLLICLFYAKTVEFKQLIIILKERILNK